MYLITDTHGTRKVAWTWGTALEWLAAAAADEAWVSNRFTGRAIARRTQATAWRHAA